MMREQIKTFYHFTAGPFLRGISKYGLIVGDVPTDIDRFKGRIGIWLTTSQDADSHGLAGSNHNKHQYRLTVQVPSNSPLLVKWTEWAPQNVKPKTIEMLHRVAGGFDTWYIYLGVIPANSITECVDTFTGNK